MGNFPPHVEQGHNARRPNARSIGAFDEPNLREVRYGIQPPLITANDFEVKSSLITMVQNQRYNGLPLEDPLDHLDLFERLCRTVKINGVPEDAIKMILFPFSLGNKASQWEKNVPSELVSTWEQVKRVFVTKFYPKQKTAKLRNDITSFKQGSHENLYEAWERLKELTRKCPHHGVSRENLLGIFYRGVHEQYRRALDTASYGCFANCTVDQGEQLIENLSQSEACYGCDYDRSLKDQEVKNQRYRELNEKIDKLSKVFLVNQRAVNFVGEFNNEQQCFQEAAGEGFQGVQDEVNYLGNQNNYQGGYENRPYNQGFRNNNLLYRSTNVENPQDQYYPPKATQGNQFQPRPYGNAPHAPNTSWRYQGGSNAQAPPPMYQPEMKPRPYVPPRGNSYQPSQADEQDDIKSMLRQVMESQARAQIENKERMDKLERKFDASHGESQARFEQVFSHLKTLDNQIAQMTASSSRPAGSFPGKPETNPRENCHVIITDKGCDDENLVIECRMEDSKKKVVKKDSAAIDPPRAEHCEVVELVTRDTVNVAGGQTTNEAAAIEPLQYIPPLPFPGRCLTKAQKKILSRFKGNMSKIGVPMPNMGSLCEVREQVKFIKAILENKEMVEELLAKEGYLDPTPLEPRVLSKQGDQGTFVIPCTLGNLVFDDALCDSGASVNVLSHEVVKLIGTDVMKENTMTLSFGDASTKQPIGKLIDYPLKIGSCTVPTDFMVVEMEPGCKIPLILGRPFLNTVGATMDFINKEVVLKRIDNKTSYPIREHMSNLCGLISIEKFGTTTDVKSHSADPPIT